MTTPAHPRVSDLTNPELPAGVAHTLARYGLKLGAEADLELLGPAAPPVRVSGRLEEAVIAQGARAVEALVLRTATNAVSVVPWHAVARVILRTSPAQPAHPAL